MDTRVRISIAALMLLFLAGVGFLLAHDFTTLDQRWEAAAPPPPEHEPRLSGLLEEDETAAGRAAKADAAWELSEDVQQELSDKRRAKKAEADPTPRISPDLGPMMNVHIIEAIRNLPEWSDEPYKRYAANSEDPLAPLYLAAARGLLDHVPISNNWAPKGRRKAVRRARKLAGKDFPFARFVALLESENAWVRTRVTWLLPVVLEEADPALGVVQRMLQTDRTDFWHTATRALDAVADLRGDRRDVLHVLRDVIDRAGSPHRLIALRSYARHADGLSEVEPMLSNLLGDDSVRVRRTAVDLLGSRARDGSETRPSLEHALLDRDSGVRGIAKEWLERLPR